MPGPIPNIPRQRSKASQAESPSSLIFSWMFPSKQKRPAPKFTYGDSPRGKEKSDYPQFHYDRRNWINDPRRWQRTREQSFAEHRTASGYYDPYVKIYSDNVSTQHIDHTVALREGYSSGGYKWPLKKKREFAYDLQNLRPIFAETNIEKGWADVGTYKPAYGRDQFMLESEYIKKKYGLTFDPLEAQEFEKAIGRKSTVGTAKPVEETRYCLSCHTPFKKYKLRTVDKPRKD